MTNTTQKIGFTYFSSPEFLVRQQLNDWMPLLKTWGASVVILPANFEFAVPEDVLVCAKENGLDPVVHFNTVLPMTRAFNEAALLLNVYKKWGVEYVIIGEQPNVKNAWPIAGWYFETLVDTFLERFIPLANHALKIGLKPVLAPLQPGGDYWDCAFMELLLSGLKARKMDELLENLTLASYGYTFHQPLSWGAGGPERWPGSQPYLTPAGQEDQLGFHNFEWIQAVAQRVNGEKLPIIILDAGRPTPYVEPVRDENSIEALRTIIAACLSPQSSAMDSASSLIAFNKFVYACIFNLETLKSLLGDAFTKTTLNNLFSDGNQEEAKLVVRNNNSNSKYLSHYLLLPSYGSGVSDVVLNKVRPLIKKLQPTVGFSLEEASRAEKVSVFPDPFLFKDEQIDQLRAAGCQVEILPETGIEIATFLQR